MSGPSIKMSLSSFWRDARWYRRVALWDEPLDEAGTIFRPQGTVTLGLKAIGLNGETWGQTAEVMPPARDEVEAIAREHIVSKMNKQGELLRQGYVPTEHENESRSVSADE